MIRRALRFAGTCAVLLAGGERVRAEDVAAGTATANFLSLGAGASAWSMAGATLASGNDLASAAWNPASLARLDARQFSLSHAPLPGGATQDWLAAGGRLGAGSARWALHALFHQEGDIEGRDAANLPTGSLSVSDLAVGGRIAHPLGRGLSAGLGAQWVHESLAGANGSGFAFDAGLRGEAGPLGYALAARNLGAGMSYGAARYDLPGVFAAGVSWSDAVRGMRLGLDVDSPQHYLSDVRVGGEWRWRERVALRAGYREELGADAATSSSGPTFGMGAGARGMWLDYAFSPGASEGVMQHRVGLTFRPGPPSLAPAAATYGPRAPNPRSPRAAPRAPSPPHIPSP